ncbi:hypothetical protein ACJJTC_008426 [Scirpophaga incertulas]
MKKFKIPSCLKSVRYCLGAINCLYLLTGILLLLCGVAVLVINKKFDLFVTQRFYNVPGFAISTGVIIIVSSALGFYAAFTENFYFVASYVVLSLAMLIFDVAAVIVAYGLKNDVVSEIRGAMSGTIQLYEQRREIAVTWDNLQMGFQCCGVTGRHDWYSDRIPVSCCHIDYGTVSPFECSLAKAYTTSCVSALSEWLGFNAQALAVTAVVVTCIQVCNTAVAAWLAYRVKYEDIDLES